MLPVRECNVWNQLFRIVLECGSVEQARYAKAFVSIIRVNKLVLIEFSDFTILFVGCIWTNVHDVISMKRLACCSQSSTTFANEVTFDCSPAGLLHYNSNCF